MKTMQRDTIDAQEMSNWTYTKYENKKADFSGNHIFQAHKNGKRFVFFT